MTANSDDIYIKSRPEYRGRKKVGNAWRCIED